MKLDVVTLQRLHQSGAKVVDERVLRNVSRDSANNISGKMPGASPTLTPQSSCAELESISSDVSSGNEAIPTSTNVSRKPYANRKEQPNSHLPAWLQSSDRNHASSIKREALRARGNAHLLAMINSQPDTSTRAKLRAKGNAVLSGLCPMTSAAVPETGPVSRKANSAANGGVGFLDGQCMPETFVPLPTTSEDSHLEALRALMWMGQLPAVDPSLGAFDVGTGLIDASDWMGQPMKIEFEGYPAELAATQFGQAPLVIAPPPGL